MDTSAEILIVAGTVAVTVGFVLGVPLARARMRAPTVSRHLVNTHMEALIAGAALLGLAVAADYSTMRSGLEVAAAWLVSAGVASSLVGGALNWINDAGDQFATRPIGFFLQAASGPAIVVGGLVFSVGVLATL